MLRFILLLTITACASLQAEDKEPAKIAVVLTDGSLLKGTPTITEIPLKTSFAEMKVPIHMVKELKRDKQTGVVSISLTNKDHIKGQTSLEVIPLQTLLGELTIKLDHIRSFTSTTSSQAITIHDSPQARSRCINNLRQMNAATEQWALETGKSTGDVINVPEALNYIKGGKTPTCPAGGTTDWGLVGRDPTCTVPGHKMP